ncbi:MAG: protein kinase, partial [Proteobacteria bacterium]|nr:protein kinase [Pseudomonadota bacterium]
MKRILGVLLGLPLLLAGVLGLLVALAPDSGATEQVQALAAAIVEGLTSAGAPLPRDAAVALEDLVSSPALRYVVAPIGLLVLLLPFRGGGGERESKSKKAKAAEPAEKTDSVVSVDKRLAKRTEKAAAQLRKKGQVLDAAEMLFSASVFETAASYFIEAEAFERAAEIRHDQNRFVEAAELYEKAGKFESAGSIFADQNEHARAAACYLKTGGKSVAAEMFEKAGDHRRAADCYRESGFQRHAAAAYVKVQDWAKAAACLDQVFSEEGAKMASLEPKKQQEMKKLIRQAANLFERAEQPDKAQSLLERGECFTDAGELALRHQQHARAADLFTRAGEPLRAAEALRELGENEAAARIVGQFHRDRGESKEAAAAFEESGDFLEAGDLYRLMEDYERAATCYQRQGDPLQAAEMWRSAGNREKAAECYESAAKFSEAAECFALSGKGDREAEMLERAARHLEAGQAYHREGMDDEAIKVLQKVPAGEEGFGEASALLGDIFRARGQLGLAIKKLKQAISGQDLSRENLPSFYALATVYEANNDLREAVDIYEKILTFDYHYQDVEGRLARLRDRVAQEPPVETTTEASGAAQSLPPGGQPGRYQILGELGRGGMGIVYKSKDTVLDRLVAYKVLPEALRENPQALKNFLREAKAAAKLNHPNIVTVYDTGEQDGRFYIAMEFVDGTTLKEILRRRGPISPTGVLHVTVQVCEALAYAHEKKVVHRDIKTANT